MHAIGFAIVDDDPVGIEFRRGIGRARVERRLLALRHFLNQTIEFGSRSLVETAALLNAEDTDRLEQPERRSEEHTSELQSLMRISYAVFCLKKKSMITTRSRSKHIHRRKQ